MFFFFFFGGGGFNLCFKGKKKTKKEIAGVFAVFRYCECHY